MHTRLHTTIDISHREKSWVTQRYKAPSKSLSLLPIADKNDRWPPGYKESLSILGLMYC